MKYIVILLRKTKNQYVYIGRKTVKPDADTLKYGHKTIPVDISTPSYIRDKTLYYFVDIYTASQLFIKDSSNSNDNEDDNSEKLTTEELDMLISRKFIRNLTDNLKENIKFHLASFILGICIGLVGIMCSVIYYTNKAWESLGNTNGTIIIPRI